MKKVNIAKMKIYGRGSRRSGGKAEVAQENKLLLLTIEKGNRDLEQMENRNLFYKMENVFQFQFCQ